MHKCIPYHNITRRRRIKLKNRHFPVEKCLFFWSRRQDIYCYAIYQARRPKGFAFRYPTSLQNAEKLALWQLFLNAFCLLKVQVLSILIIKKADTQWYLFFLWSRRQDTSALRLPCSSTQTLRVLVPDFATRA